MTCLTENLVLQFVDGRLQDDARAVVDRHMAECDECRVLVAEAAKAAFVTRHRGPMASSFTADTVPEHAVDGQCPSGPLEGRAVGRYVAIRPIGWGGMGVVYLAYDPQLGRHVALKLLRADAAATEAARSTERLLGEARAMARLTHPNVVMVHDAGLFEDQVFIAMELVEGRTLRQWWLEAPRSWRDVLAVFVAAGHGLAAAHTAGLIHRDFKPDNVLVGLDGRVRVTDLGLARPLDGTAEPGALAAAPPVSTSVGAVEAGSPVTASRVAGTPAYMAPEQFLSQPADVRTDQFSFCVALYEGLCGRRPFAGATIDELSSEVRHGRLRPVEAPLPPALTAALQRGLSTSRDARFASMDELLRQLTEILDETATARRRGVRHPVALVIGLALLAVALIGTAGVWQLRSRAPVANASSRPPAGLPSVPPASPPPRALAPAGLTPATRPASAPVLTARPSAARRSRDGGRTSRAVRHPDQGGAIGAARDRDGLILEPWQRRGRGP